jgi:hypothetical protein
MILLFLGSWRSTLIIAVSIPLSILTSVMVLSFLGETINIMLVRRRVLFVPGFLLTCAAAFLLVP